MSVSKLTKLRDDLDRYPNSKSAYAFFFKTAEGPSFRLEAEIGWEFSEGLYIGPDPQGELHYLNGYFEKGILSPTNPNDAWYYAEIVSEQNEDYVHIKFYAPGSRNDSDVFAEFLGKDKLGNARNSGLMNQYNEGAWRKVDYVSFTMAASKLRGDKRITIKDDAELLTITVNCDDRDQIKDEALNGVDGQLYVEAKAWRSIAQDGAHVRWYSDHAVFMHDGYLGSVVTAFFNVFDSQFSDPLGSAPENGYDWDGVKWIK